MIIIVRTIFFSALLICLGVLLISSAFDWLQLQDFQIMLSYLQSTTNSHIILGISGLLLVVIGFALIRLKLDRFQRERTIAFSTPSGPVTIALTAVEDLIRRLTGVLSEIKELRPNVVAGKKGITVDLRVVLRHEANIPDLTARLQYIIRSRIQEVLGTEEEILIKIHVAKIVSGEDKDHRRRRDADKQEHPIPYGFGRA